MILKKIPYYLLTLVTLTSCRQFKSLTSRDHSSAPTPARQNRTKNVRFLDNISVAPGQVVTSKHTNGPALPKPKRSGKTTPTRQAETGDLERADWLQIKYAILLDAPVENLNNVGLLQLIDDWWGTRYCMGGSTKACIDCSAFTQVIINHIFQVSLPRTAQEQYNQSDKIGLEELAEGDLVFFHTGGRDISHVGIYLLNNKFVHASTSNGVMVSDLNDTYWRSRYKGSGRINKISRL